MRDVRLFVLARYDLDGVQAITIYAYMVQLNKLLPTLCLQDTIVERLVIRAVIFIVDHPARVHDRGYIGV